MRWDKINLMFPEGRTLMNDNTTVQDLYDYDMYIGYRTSNARNMVIKHEKLSWTADGDYFKEILYDVNSPNTIPGSPSCLSVYGNRMVADYFQRPEYYTGPTSSESEELQNVGFSYTGIQ